MAHYRDPNSIRETDRIYWYHRLLMFAGGVAITTVAALMLKFELTYTQPNARGQQVHRVSVNSLLALFFWILVGPIIAITSLLPIREYFNTIEIVHWRPIQEQACQGCQQVGDLELYNSRSMFSKQWTNNLIYCKSCGHHGRHQRDPSDPSLLAVGTVTHHRTVASSFSFDGGDDRMDDPILKARAILEASKLKRALQGASYEGLSLGETINVEMVENQKESPTTEEGHAEALIV